ncbi:HAMP domain-containing sensor histidine kinase [Oribacterium parvum]|uniref:sensor histidine kinase n=1 Tax=Oribacterium parvum TaxID=1501329 RepID=UPI0028EE83E9|nr:HAMP domain-containing sensor histidine kinase [Oribacterium parvum]
MKNLKLFPKMFIQLFSVLGILILLIHLLVFFIFPISYLEQRKEAITNRANEVSAAMEGKSLTEIENTLALYSKSSDIHAFVKNDTESLSIPVDTNIPIDDTVSIDFDSKTNSMIIEEREIKTNTGERLSLLFISTADMQKEAKELSLQFLPYSLAISLLFSAVVSLIYAKAIKNHIQEIKNETDKMIALNEEARLEVDSKDEVGELKAQINTLYRSLLQSIENVEKKNQEILRLEKLKYDFLKGASHELKTPLASLKIILENMQYNIGKYKDRDRYIGECIATVDSLSQNISQILSVSSLENLKEDEENLEIQPVLRTVLEKYKVLLQQKKLHLKNELQDEKLYIGKPALKIILSNLLSNAVKYTEEAGAIRIYADEGWFYLENSFSKRYAMNFDLSKENSNGLGLYIVSTLLNNYKIPYESLEKDGKFVFRIKLS